MICQWWYDLSSYNFNYFFRQAKHIDRFKAAILSRLQSENLEFDPEDFEIQESDQNNLLDDDDEDLLDFNVPETITLDLVTDQL